MEKKNLTACFTGHRVLQESPVKVKERLEEVITELVEDGFCYFIAGGALGFDTLAAQVILELRNRKYSHINLLLALPFRGQEKAWSAINQAVYNNIKQKADCVVCLSETYLPFCMHKRNKYMVDNSSVCICYLRENKGGTMFTVKYATENERTLIHL